MVAAVTSRLLSIKSAQLSGRRLVMLNNTSGSRQAIEATLARTRTRVDILLELAQPSSILGMVEAGIGIAVVPQLAAPRSDDTLLATCRLTEPSVSRTILLLRRRDRSLSPAAAAVWAALLELYRPASGEIKRVRKPLPRAAKKKSPRHKKPRA